MRESRKLSFLHQKFVNASPNHLHILLRKFPNEAWSHSRMSSNPNLRFSFVLQNLNKMWSFGSLSTYSKLEDIINNPTLPWEDFVYGNENVTWEVLAPLARGIQSRNDPFSNAVRYRINWYQVSVNESITWDIVKENPEFPWVYSQLSRNGNITWEIIVNNPKHPWNAQWISYNPNITWKIVKENPERFWDYNFLSCNSNITLQEIFSTRDNPEIFRRWRWDFIGMNDNITWENVKENREFSWSFSWISKNENITPEIIRNNPEEPWDLERIFILPSIRWHQIVRHIKESGEKGTKVAWDYLSTNKFNYSVVVYNRLSKKIKRNRMRMCGCSFVNWY